jgi:hypothetical protein
VPRRGSYDPQRPKEKTSSHKKSHSGPKESPSREEPIVVNASPNTRHTPTFSKSASSPPIVPDSPRGGIPRAKTFHEPSTSRPGPQPVPGIPRAHTFAGEATADSRGRSRTRLQAQVEEPESDSEDDRLHRERKHRSSRRTHSPEPAVAYVAPRTSSSAKTYTVKDGRTQLQDVYRESPDRHKAYYKTTTAVRPDMATRETSYSSSGNARFPKYKTARAYTQEDVAYASYGSLPEGSYREAVYASGGW